MKIDTKKITVLAMLSALAFLTVFMAKSIGIPIITALPFLTYDPKDVIITIGGFFYGPLAAFSMSVIVSLVEMITISSTGPIGMIMNIISSCAFACTAAFIYKKRRTVSGAVAGLVTGIFLMTGVMILWNYLITPFYMLIQREAVVKLLIPGFLPFNLIKSTLNAAITMLLYKPLSIALRQLRIIPKSETSPVTVRIRKVNIGIVIISCFVIATCVLLILAYQGKLG